MNIDFYKGMHESQIKRNEHFTNELRLTISGLVILGGVFGYILPSVEFTQELGKVQYGVNILYCMGSVLYVVALFYLVKAYLSPELIDLSPSQTWLAYEKELGTKYNGDTENKAENEFTSKLVQTLSETATTNQGVNDRVGSAVQKSNKFLLFAFLVVLPSLLFSKTINNVEQQQTIIKVECD